MDHNRALSNKFPAGLAGVLNGPEQNRDSAYYSMGDPSSKHNSTMSTNGQTDATPPSSGYQSSGADKTPSPIATNLGRQPLQSPSSGGMSVASMVSPTSATNDYSGPRRFDSGPNSAGLPPSEEAGSRRQSVDSRLGNNFGDLRLASSPYASHNQSTSSLQSALSQQRNPASTADRCSTSRLSNGYQPQRLPDALSPRHIVRTAPAITGPAPGNIARAPEAIVGQAWAFPEEPINRLPSNARPSAESSNRQGTSFLDDSRRSSIADSISSRYTTESRLPPGQRRLEDGMPSDHRLSRASSEFQPSHHHHSLQNRQLGDLQGDDAGSPSGGQSYSRTPELRVSHKLAERKRRTEMKQLFDDLRDLMPQERGSKASKWEILSKAIKEHEKMNDVISQQDRKIDVLQREVSGLRQELATAHTIIASHGSQHGSQLNQMPHIGHLAVGSAVNGREYDRTQRVHGYPNQSQEQLPPIRNLGATTHAGPGPESMSGIQYQHDNRLNGFRP